MFASTVQFWILDGKKVIFTRTHMLYILTFNFMLILFYTSGQTLLGGYKTT